MWSFLLNKYFISGLIILSIIGGISYKYYSLTSEIDNLTEVINTKNSEIDILKFNNKALEISLKNIQERNNILEKNIKTKNKSIKKLDENIKILSTKTFKVPEVVIHQPDLNATGIPSILGKIGY
jgi:hypothetical protein